MAPFDTALPARQAAPMLFWSGLAFIALGIAAFAIDRRATHFFHDHISFRVHRFLNRTTDLAKGAHWLAISVAVFVIANLAQRLGYGMPVAHRASNAALAFVVSLAVGTIVIHVLKIVLGRRRPRDEMDHGFFGFLPMRFDLQYDSFPSGHALTISCVAVIFSSLFPSWSPLWFAVALYLALTRALANAHFLSDVCFGIGIGLLTVREVVFYFFPALLRPWF
jgi:membrane-associated phospholipid phosphatase